MRKLTGYIGAMIIVFALMGSVLAGYALNINGNSAIVNEYEHVTDVSGLYNYSEEKSYIDYNPASNYINYSQTVQNDDPPYFISYKMWDGNHTLTYNSNTITLDGVVQNSIDFTASNFNIFVSDKILVYCYYGLSYCGIWVENDNVGVFSNNFTVTKSGSTVTLSGINLNTGTAFTTTSKTVRFALSYSSNADYDYYNVRIANIAQPPDVLPAYYGINPENKIYSSGSSTAYGAIITENDKIYDFSSNNSTEYNLYNPVMVANNVYYSSDVIYNHLNAGYTCTELYIPKTEFVTLGINYSESNRVNNYPVINENANTQIQTDRIDLMNISASDYWPADTSGLGWQKTWYIVSHLGGNLPQYQFTAPYYTTTSQSSHNRAYLHDYKLSDILNTYNIPSNTQTIKITSNSTDIRNYTDNGISVNIDCNIVGFVYLPTQNILTLTNACLANEKDFIIYDLDNGVCTVYDYNGVSKFTAPPSDIGVLFCDNTANYGWLTNVYSGGTTSQAYDMAGRARPFIDITSMVYNPADIDYIDITKGYTIKSSNMANTIWDNEFENGNIQLLFRAIDVNGTYQNTITVSGNDINIDYTNNRYYITLGADSIDIGTWRNIVLDIDLINGKLSAIPVRTFNSFTNVILDNSVVNIGNLTDASPTNTITWAPTNESLMFNVYSTDVFLNTYGVVMINPSLTIMDYFPDLGQFYRLKMYNFATYGDSITINGETYPVTNGTITIDNKNVTLKNLYIEYANGDVTVKDDHIEINTGAIVSDTVSMTGTWYFLTDLEKGYTTQKMVYDWDWGAFIIDNTQFVVIYVGLLGVSLIVARRFCNLSITDYALMIISVIIALSVQVIA